MTGELHPTSVLTAPGMAMPVIGLGTWQAEEDEVVTALDVALKAGYRLIDTAYRYRNEASIGRALRRWFESGKICREELFVTTKLPPEGMNERLVEEYLKRSLTALQLSYVDLYLLHHPVGFKEEVMYSKGLEEIPVDISTDHVAIWKAMEAQVDAGRAKAIGVSNFNSSQVDRLLRIAQIPPANLQKDLQEWSRKSGVTLTAYAPLGSPNMSSFITKHGAIAETKNLNPLNEPTVTRIAQSHGKTPAQVLLRHLVQLGVAVIPKSSNPNRIVQNFQVFDFKLSSDEMEELNSLDKGEVGRRFKGSFFKGIETHPEYPFK